jgi:hypothetical protein
VTHPFVVSSVSVEFVPALKRSIRASIPATEEKSETASVALNVPLIAPVRVWTMIFRAARYCTTSSLKSALLQSQRGGQAYLHANRSIRGFEKDVVEAERIERSEVRVQHCELRPERAERARRSGAAYVRREDDI